MINLVIFDWSGPISEDRRCVYAANMRIFRGYGKPIITYDEWLRELPQSQAAFMRSRGIHLEPDELFRVYTEHYDYLVKQEVPPPCLHPDVRETLEYLKEMGKKLAVVSSHPEGNLLREAEAYKLTHLFDMIVGSMSVGSSSGKAGGLIMVCDKLEVSPGCTLFVGDMGFDIQAARMAGTLSAGISGPRGKPLREQRGYQTIEALEKEDPDFLLGSLLELQDVIS